MTFCHDLLSGLLPFDIRFGVYNLQGLLELGVHTRNFLTDTAADSIVRKYPVIRKSVQGRISQNHCGDIHRQMCLGKRNGDTLSE